MPVANRFDPRKNHMNLLFHFGRVLQDSEMNEIMSLFWHQISTFSGLIMHDGMATKQPEPVSQGWECPDAFVVIGGHFVFVAKKNLPKGSLVGVRHRKKVITSKENPDLEDQTEGSVNEGQEGADRVLIEAEWFDVKMDGREEEWDYVMVFCNAWGQLGRLSNMMELTAGSWDAVVIQHIGSVFDDRVFSSLDAALLAAKPGWRILVKGEVASVVQKTINIDQDDLYIEFAPGIKKLVSPNFPQTGEDSERSIYYITGKNVTLVGGIHGFPENKTEDPDKRPRIATSTNDSTFFNNIRKVGVSKYALFSENININGEISVRND